MPKKFLLWIALFFILLSAIPFLAFHELFTAAKILGITTVVLVSIAIRLWTAASRKQSQHANRVLLNRNDLFWLEKHCPFFVQLSKEDQAIFKDRMGLFLANIAYAQESGVTPDREDCFPAAALYVVKTFNNEWNLPEDYKEIKLIADGPDQVADGIRQVSNESLKKALNAS